MEHVHASLVAQQVKNPPANAGDVGSIPGPERSPGEGNGPDGPVVRTLSFHCRGPGFHPWSEN